MKKLSVFAALLVLFAGTAAELHGDRPGGLPAPNPAMLDSSAAFRDGLYLGQFTARRGDPVHVATGRWATASDRDLFAAGYQQGYHQVQLASLARARQAQ